MDKKKTGSLIKEARIKKNYTQSELGDLLGVTNKAVSRWENGDSFPDICLLENLSRILDVKIQDIVVGEISTEETVSSKENIITDVIRLARLQEKSKQKRMLYYLGGGICILLYSLILELAGMNGSLRFGNDITGGVFYSVSLAVMHGVVLWSVWFMRQRQAAAAGKNRNRISRIVLLTAAITYAYAVLAAGISVVMAAHGVLTLNENRLFNAQSAGSFLSIQLAVVFFINFAMLVMEMIKIGKESADIHYGIFVSISAMYMAMLYSDMFHIMSTAEAVLRMYIIRTLSGLVLTGGAMLAFSFLERTVGEYTP